MTKVTLSRAARQHIANILKAQPNKYALRISVEGGGCFGFSYKYDLVSQQKKSDFLIEQNGARVVIDSVSLSFLKGAVIDFTDTLMGQSFEIKNPNATASCGCRSSFSITL